MHEKSREFLIKWISFFLLHGFWFFFIKREVEFEKVDKDYSFFFFIKVSTCMCIVR